MCMHLPQSIPLERQLCFVDNAAGMISWKPGRPAADQAAYRWIDGSAGLQHMSPSAG